MHSKCSDKWGMSVYVKASSVIPPTAESSVHPPVWESEQVRTAKIF